MRLWTAVWVLVGMGASAGAQISPASQAASKGCHARMAPLSAPEAALSREEYQRALDLYRSMDAADADDSRAGVIRTLIAQDKVKDAEDLAQAWVKEQPKNAMAVESLGEALYRKGELGDAYQTIQAAHALDACSARVYLMDALVEELTGNHKLAKTHKELAHRLAPNDFEIREAWIGTLPRQRQRVEWSAVLQDESLMNAKERQRLQEGLAHMGGEKVEECSLATPVDSATLRIRPIMDGPYWTGERGLYVSMNGHERELELDTGASGLTLSKAAAVSLGLVREQRSATGGIGDKGEVATSIAHVLKLKIGNLEFHNCPVEILENRKALDNDGLIGGDIFRKFLLTLDFPKSELRLSPLPERPDETKPGAVDEDVVYDRYIAPEMKDWTKVYRVGHELLLPIRIGDAKWRLFLVDTGADSMLISPDAAREFTKVKTDIEAHVSGISGEVKTVYETGKLKIEFANLFQTVDRMTSIDTMSISHDAGVEVSGLLGESVMRRLVVHIDYRDNLVKFDYDPRN